MSYGIGRVAGGIAIACALAFPVSVGAQQPSASLTPQQLNGEWSGTLALDNGDTRLLLAFAVTDSVFAGRVYADGMLVGEMSDGSIKANVVHFKVDRYDFTGTVTGGRMSIDLVVWNGSTRKVTAIKTREAGGQYFDNDGRPRALRGMTVRFRYVQSSSHVDHPRPL